MKKFKVNDIVVPKIGPHKGKRHSIIYVGTDSYTIKPLGIKPADNKYRLGAARVSEDQIVLVK